MMLFKNFNRLATTAGLLAGLLASSAAYAQTSLVVGYQQIVGPFVAAIADGRFDAAAKEAGYTIDWRQFNSWPASRASWSRMASMSTRSCNPTCAAAGLVAWTDGAG